MEERRRLLLKKIVTIQNCVTCKGRVESTKFRRVTPTNHEKWNEKLQSQNLKVKINQKFCAKCYDMFLSPLSPRVDAGLDGSKWKAKKHSRKTLRIRSRERSEKIFDELKQLKKEEISTFYKDVLPELLLPSLASVVAGLSEGSLKLVSTPLRTPPFTSNTIPKGKRKNFGSLTQDGIVSFLWFSIVNLTDRVRSLFFFETSYQLLLTVLLSKRTTRLCCY